LSVTAFSKGLAGSAASHACVVRTSEKNQTSTKRSVFKGHGAQFQECLNYEPKPVTVHPLGHVIDDAIQNQVTPEVPEVGIELAP